MPFFLGRLPFLSFLSLLLAAGVLVQETGGWVAGGGGMVYALLSLRQGWVQPRYLHFDAGSFCCVFLHAHDSYAT